MKGLSVPLLSFEVLSSELYSAPWPHTRGVDGPANFNREEKSSEQIHYFCRN